MLKQCMTCAEQEKIVNESLSHKIKFTADYYELDEEEREELSYNEERSYLVDPAKEDVFQEDSQIRHGKHLSSCDDPNCQRLKQNWKEHDELSKYII